MQHGEEHGEEDSGRQILESSPCYRPEGRKCVFVVALKEESNFFCCPGGENYNFDIALSGYQLYNNYLHKPTSVPGFTRTVRGRSATGVRLSHLTTFIPIIRLPMVAPPRPSDENVNIDAWGEVNDW